MKFKFLITGICLLIIFIFPSWGAAQEDDAAVDQIREAVKEKVKAKIDSTVSRNVGLVGKINLITENTVELLTAEQQKITVITDADTKYVVVPGRGAVKRTDLELNKDAIVLGTEATDNEEVAAKIIQLVEVQPATKRKTLWGTIKSVNRQDFTLVNEGTDWTINFSSQTDFRRKNVTAELEEIKYTDLETGDQIIAGGEVDEKDELQLDGLLILKLGTKPE